MFERLKYIVNILIVALLLGAVAIAKDGRVLSYTPQEIFSKSQMQDEATIETTLADGTRVISSASLGKDVIGYGGRTPVKLYVSGDKIIKVEYEDNDETPSFFEEILRRDLAQNWVGLNLNEAATKRVDVVSGATYSSEAVIKNVQLAAAYGANLSASGSQTLQGLDLKQIVGLLVILSSVIITLLRPKRKIFEIVQLALNVAVLGLWCGAFLSLSQFVSWLSNGFNLSATLLGSTLLIVTLIMPIFGRKGSYCHLSCPMGAAQALLGFIPAPKLKLSPRTNSALGKLRYYILFALLFFMWIGAGFDLMNYEVFSAFLLSAASTTVLIMATIFLILSIFITKPYCRFICPTGALLTIMQRSKE
ncbi:MAG: FMN-binding protein [Rikenellaceae bacterium]